MENANSLSTGVTSFLQRCKYAHFSLWRICLGAYFLYYALALFPYLDELYASGSGGLAPVHFLSGGLNSISEVQLLQFFGLVTIFLSALLCFGIFRRQVCFILFCTQVLFMNLNPMIFSPEQGLLNWFLLLLTVIPNGEPLSFGRKLPGWKLPRFALIGAWVVCVLTYFFSGLAKLNGGDTAWLDGTGLYHILCENFLSRPMNQEMLCAIPVKVFWPLTWGGLFIEVGGIFMLLTERLRQLWWILALLMILGILLTLDLNQVAWALLLAHLFLFNPKWVSA